MMEENSILEQINDVAFAWHSIEFTPYDHKSNMKPLGYRYRANNKNCRSSNSLLTFKCELLFQMTKQSYPSSFTLAIGFISIKR